MTTLIIATRKGKPTRRAADRLNEVLGELGLETMKARFFTPANAA